VGGFGGGDRLRSLSAGSREGNVMKAACYSSELTERRFLYVYKYKSKRLDALFVAGILKDLRFVPRFMDRFMC
jgi:hypothetical protein